MSILKKIIIDKHTKRALCNEVTHFFGCESKIKQINFRQRVQDEGIGIH